MSSALASISLNLIEERRFTAQLPDRTISDLELVSEWEGFAKLRHPCTGFHLFVHLAESRVIGGSAALINSLVMGANEHFVTVPRRVLPGGRLVPAFHYAKYPCAKGADGKALLSPSEKPWVNVSYRAAVAACDAAGYQLARESQELAIRLDICEQDINWTGGKVGEGKVYQGLHLGTVTRAQPADYVSCNSLERSWHQLSNGERVYGLAGNIYTWSFDDIQGDASGVTNKAFDAGTASIATAPYPSKKKGMGYVPDSGTDWSGRALVRGGCWSDEDLAGVFLLRSAYPDDDLDYVGFRCTKPI